MKACLWLMYCFLLPSYAGPSVFKDMYPNSLSTASSLPDETMDSFGNSDESLDDLDALRVACQTGNEAMLDRFVYMNLDAPFPNDGRTPLMMAVVYAQESLVRKLLVLRVSVNQVDVFGMTALMHAAKNKHLPILKLLLSVSDVQLKDHLGYTALVYAVLGNQSLAVWLLIQRGARVNQYTRGGRTPLMMAVSRGYVDMLETLLMYGADINAKTLDEGMTPLMLAASLNHPASVDLLVAFKADVFETTHTGETALFYAARVSSSRIALSILRAADGLHHLIPSRHNTAQSQDSKTQTAVLQHGYPSYKATLALDEEENPSNLKSSSLSSMRGHVGLFKSAQGLLNCEDASGRTALHVAVYHQAIELVEMFLDHNADPDKYYRNEPNSAMRGMDSHSVSLESELSLASDDAVVQGKTPLMVASQLGDVASMALLLKSNAIIDLTTMNGRTALFFAAKSGRAEAVALLLKMGAQWNWQDFQGKTALHYALEKSHADVIQAFKDNVSPMEDVEKLLNSANGHSFDEWMRRAKI